MFAECGRITADDLERGMKTFAGLRMKLNNFRKQLDGSQKWNTTDEDRVPIRPEWTTVDRILDMRLLFHSSLEVLVCLQVLYNTFWK